MMTGMSIHPIKRLVREDVDAIVPTFTLGDRMRKALEHTGTPVQEMAEYLEVSRQTIGNWLHDRSPVKTSTLVIWAAATGVSLEWLETGTAGLQKETGGEVYAIRDSNPEPADMESRARLRVIQGGSPGVNPVLTVERPGAGVLTLASSQPCQPRHTPLSCRTSGSGEVGRLRHLRPAVS